MISGSTSRPLYVLQFGQTRWGRLGWPQFGQTLTRGASIPCWARRLSRRDFEVFCFGTAIGPRQYSYRSCFNCWSAAQRGSTSSSSCTCGSWFRSRPQSGHRPAQSGRQRIFSGSARMSASRAQADRSSRSSIRYGVVSSSVSGLVAWYSRSWRRLVDDGVREAAHARPVQADGEPELEDEAGGGAGDGELAPGTPRALRRSAHRRARSARSRPRPPPGAPPPT